MKVKSYWRQGLRVPISRVCDSPLPPWPGERLHCSRSEQSRTVRQSSERRKVLPIHNLSSVRVIFLSNFLPRNYCPCINVVYPLDEQNIMYRKTKPLCFINFSLCKFNYLVFFPRMEGDTMLIGI